MNVDVEKVEAIEPAPSPWGYAVILGILSFVGFVVCFNILTGYDVNKPSGLVSNPWFCGGEDSVDYGCSGVFASRFGKIFGVPLPGYGAAYFLLIFLWILLFGKETFNVLLAIILAGGAVVSGLLIYVLYFVLPGQCRWCLLVHLINGLIIFTSIVAFIRIGGVLNLSGIWAKITKAFLAVFIVLTLFCLTVIYTYRDGMARLTKAYEVVRLSECYQRGLYASQKARMIKIEPDDHVLGDRQARVKVVIYKDFQCSFCYEAWRIVKSAYEKINAEKKNNVCIVARHFPLYHRCNRYVKTEMHPYACAAARASEAVFLAAGESAYWKYNDLLMERHKELDESPYVWLANEVGVSENQFFKMIKDPRVNAKIEKDCASLHNLGIQVAVPIIFINGRFVDGWKIKGFIETLIKEELK